MKHKTRFYRDYTFSSAFNVKIDTSDLYVIANPGLYETAFNALRDARKELEEYIVHRDEFLHSLNPLSLHGDEKGIIAAMCRASESAGVGPMAAVAGAIAEEVGSELIKYTDEVVVENGGDIWLKLKSAVVVKIYVDNIYFRDRIGISIEPDETPCSLCTSTSRLGHSLSFGKADSVTVIADTGALADAAATAVCNMVQCEDDMVNALEFGMSVNGVRGCLIIFRDKMAVIGNIKLTSGD